MRAHGLHASIGSILLVALLVSGQPAGARADAPAAESDEHSPFFVAGPAMVGLTLGYAHGAPLIATGTFESGDVRALLVLPFWQMDVTRAPLRPAWYKGRLAIRTEPAFMVNMSPRSGYGAGFALLLRYRLTRWARVAPYLEIGAGPYYIDLDIRDQADGFAFIPEAGAGLSWRAAERLFVDLGVRFQHISNAYTKLPNGGIDTVQILLGAGYVFD